MPYHQLLEFAQTHVHRISDAITPSHPLSSPSSPAFNLSRIRDFSNETILCIRWPKYWSFSFSISPSNEYSGLISFRIDWFYLLAVKGTLKRLLQYQLKSINSSAFSFLYIIQLSHPYMTIEKITTLTRWTSVGKVASSLFNMLSKFVKAFLKRSKHFLISWLQPPSAVVLEPKKINSVSFHCFPIYLPWS